MKENVYIVRDANGDIDTVFVGNIDANTYMALKKRLDKVGHYLEMHGSRGGQLMLETRIAFIEEDVNG